MTLVKETQNFKVQATSLIKLLNDSNLIKASAVHFEKQIHSCLKFKSDSLSLHTDINILISESNHRCQIAYVEAGSLNILVISLWHQNHFDFRNRVYNNERALQLGKQAVVEEIKTRNNTKANDDHDHEESHDHSHDHGSDHGSDQEPHSFKDDHLHTHKNGSSD